MGRHKENTSMWARATYGTRQDILLLMQLMGQPSKWDSAKAWANSLHTELMDAKRCRPDQDVLEMFFTKIYPQWEELSTGYERAMLLKAKEKYDQLPAAERGRRRDVALQSNKSHLDAMGVKIEVSNPFFALVGKMRALSMNEHFNPNTNPPSRLMLPPAQEQEDGVIDRHFMD